MWAPSSKIKQILRILRKIYIKIVKNQANTAHIMQIEIVTVKNLANIAYIMKNWNHDGQKSSKYCVYYAKLRFPWRCKLNAVFFNAAGPQKPEICGNPKNHRSERCSWKGFVNEDFGRFFWKFRPGGQGRLGTSKIQANIAYIMQNWIRDGQKSSK